MRDNDLWNEFLNKEPQTEVKEGLKKLNLEVVFMNRHAKGFMNDEKCIDIEFNDDTNPHYGHKIRVRDVNAIIQENDVGIVKELETQLQGLDRKEIGQTIKDFAHYKYIYGVKDLKEAIKAGQTDFSDYTIKKVNSKGLKLQGLDFSGSSIDNWSLGNAQIIDCNFNNSRIDHSGIGNSRVSSSFENATVYVEFWDCDLTDSSFNNSKLDNFSDSNVLTNVKMKNTGRSKYINTKSDLERFLLMNESDVEAKIITIDTDNPMYQILEMKYADAGLPDNRFIAVKNGDEFIVQTLTEKPLNVKETDYSIDEELGLLTLIQEQFDSEKPNNLKNDVEKLGIKLVGASYSEGVVKTTFSLNKDSSKTFDALTQYSKEEIGYYNVKKTLQTKIQNLKVYDEFIKDQFISNPEQLKRIEQDIKLLSVNTYQKHREELVAKQKPKQTSKIEQKQVQKQRSKNRLTR